MGALSSLTYFRDLEGADRSLMETNSAPHVHPTNFSDLLSSAMWKDNLLASSSLARSTYRAPVAGYNALAQEPDLERNYPNHRDLFARSRSPEETADMRLRIDFERRNNLALSNSQSMTQSLLAGVAAGMSSPENVIPFGTAFGVGRAGLGVLKSAAVAGLAGGATAGVAEVGLHGTQVTRTPEESFAAVAGATVIPGLLGAGFGFRFRMIDATAREVEGVRATFVEDLEKGTFGSNIEQYLPEGFNKMGGKAKELALFNAQLKWSADSGRLTASGGLFGRTRRAIVRAFAKIDPQGRLVSQDISDTAAFLGMRMAATGRIVKGAEAFGPVAEAHRDLIEYQLKRTRMTFDDHFRDYSATAKSQGEQPVDRNQFSANVVYSLWNDAPIEGLPTHQAAAVQRAMTDVRTVLDDIYNRLESTGYVSGQDFKGVMEAFFPTKWNMERIQIDPDGFRNFLMENGLDGNESDRVVNALTDYTSKDILGSGIYESSHLRDITLKIPRPKLAEADWISLDIHEALESYGSQMSGRIALAEAFGRFPTETFSRIMGDIEGAAQKGLARSTVETYLVRETIKDMRFMGALGGHISEESDKLAVHLEGLGFRRSNLFREKTGLETTIAYRRDEFGESDQIAESLAERLRGVDEQYRTVIDEIESVRDRVSRDSRTHQDWGVHRDPDKPKERNRFVSHGRAKGIRTKDAFRKEIVALKDRAADVRSLEATFASDLKGWIAATQREVQEKISSAKSDRQRRRIHDRGRKIVRNIEHIRDKVANVVGMPQDPHHLGFRAEANLRKLAVVTMLPNVGLSSLTDVGMHIHVNGAARNLRGLAAALRDGKFKEEIGRDELVRGVVAMENVGGANRFMKLHEVPDTTMTRGVVGSTLDFSLNVFGKLTGIQWWNKNNRAWATMMIQDRVIGDCVALTKGTLSRSGVDNLRIAGIDENLARKIVAEWRKAGSNSDVVMGQRFHYSRSDTWEDLDTRRKFQAAVVADVNRTILVPGAGEQPRFMSIPYVRMIGAFKSFAFASNAKTFSSAIQRGDVNSLMGALSMSAIGLGIYASRQWLKGKEISEDPKVWAMEAVDRGGTTGILMDVNNIMEVVTRGRIGASSLLGVDDGIRSRYRSRSMLDAVFGPMVGLTENVINTASLPFKEGGATDAEISRASKLIPYSTHWAMDVAYKLLGEEQ